MRQRALAHQRGVRIHLAGFEKRQQRERLDAGAGTDHAPGGDLRVICSQHAAGVNIQHDGRAALPGHCLGKCLIQVGIAGLSA